jgi:hypothetical protein
MQTNGENHKQGIETVSGKEQHLDTKSVRIQGWKIMHPKYG